MARWDYQQHGGVYRDVQDEGIIRLIARGELKGDDKVAHSGTDRWSALSDVPAFSTALSRAAGVSATGTQTTLPDASGGIGGRLYFAWFLITIATSAYSWHLAESYNPEGNGMLNLVEASLSNQAWLQVIAALLSAIFSSLFFAAALIAGRLRKLAEINRAGLIAVIEELRRGR